MDKPPFYLRWPQKLYESFQSYQRFMLISSAGITIWVLFGSTFISPFFFPEGLSPTSAPMMLPEGTQISQLTVEPSQTATAMPTNTPSPSPTIRPTSLPTSTATHFFTDIDISQWPIVLNDSFDSNVNEWTVGGYEDELNTGEILIANGKFRWDIIAKQEVFFHHWLTYAPVTDFSLAVDGRQSTGDPSIYGLIFRGTVSNDLYYFAISEVSQRFNVSLFHRNEWRNLLGWTWSPYIRSGEVNQFRIIVKGSEFIFFINNELVERFKDDTLVEGSVGLAVELINPDDEAVFEFDNFELRVPPAQDSGTIENISTTSSTPSSQPSSTIVPPTQKPPTPVPPTKKPPPPKKPPTPAPP